MRENNSKAKATTTMDETAKKRIALKACLVIQRFWRCQMEEQYNLTRVLFQQMSDLLGPKSQHFRASTYKVCGQSVNQGNVLASAKRFVIRVCLLSKQLYHSGSAARPFTVPFFLGNPLVAFMMVYYQADFFKRMGDPEKVCIASFCN